MSNPFFAVFVVMVFVANISRSYASDLPESLPSQHSYSSMLFRPFNAVLDVVCAPLHFMSTKSYAEQLEDKFKTISKVLHKKVISPELKVDVLHDLESCASAGHPQAMYVFGSLLLGCPAEPYNALEALIERDRDLGFQYVDAAANKGSAEAISLRQQCWGATKLESLVNDSLEVASDEEKQKFAARVTEEMPELVRVNPHAAFYCCDAILNKEKSAYPWMSSSSLSLLDQRTIMSPLLKFAVKNNVLEARRLMYFLEQEDAVYVRVCESIMKNPEKIIKGLSMWDPGYLQEHISFLVEQTIEERGYVLTKEYALFIKSVMGLRMNQVFYFLGSYFSYIRISRATEFNDGEIGTLLHVMSVRKMGDLLVGKTNYFLEPIWHKDYEKGLSVDFTEHKLYCAVTKLDVHLALGMLLDFEDHPFPEVANLVME
ncbi:MAG: hypothetical protein KBB83_01110 [Alphaproteobacteria bacterium]|nr:hypothetical protein [Alphaproteobacteria bacterium]